VTGDLGCENGEHQTDWSNDCNKVNQFIDVVLTFSSNLEGESHFFSLAKACGGEEVNSSPLPPISPVNIEFQHKRMKEMV